MNQIILGKDEKRVIPIMLGSDVRHPEFISGSRNKFGMTEGRLDVVLSGENSSVEVVGLVMPAPRRPALRGEVGGGKDDRSLEVYITHAAPNTKSNVNVRAVLRGRALFSFRGNVKIEKGAKGADAYLRSDALLFDDAKMGDDTPALEILEKDVKAGHAATVGKVDAQMLFYLMSRGISRKQAEEMLVEGFVEPVREKIMAARRILP